MSILRYSPNYSYESYEQESEKQLKETQWEKWKELHSLNMISCNLWNSNLFKTFFSVSKCSGPDLLSWSIHSNIWIVFACFKWICKHLLQTPETAKLPSSTFLLKCTSSNSLKVSTSLRHRPRAKAPKNIPNQSALKMHDARRDSGEMWGSCSACGTPESLLASIKSCRARRRSWPSLRLCHWTQWYMAATNYWPPKMDTHLLKAIILEVQPYQLHFANNHQNTTSWWFQPVWKILVKLIGSSP